MEVSIFTALFEQVLHQPACLLVIVAIIILAYLAEIWPNVDSRWIPVGCIIVGPILYPIFAGKATVATTYPYPFAVLLVNGLIAGFIACITHSKVILWLIKKYGATPPDLAPKQPNEPGNKEETSATNKSNHE